MDDPLSSHEFDVPVRETAAFLAHWLPAGSALLEVGCGDGQVAAELSKRGHRVRAIDADPVAIASARVLGVEAIVASWPEFEGGPFDAVAFTRSLHHIAPLDDAVDRAFDSLRSGGQLLIEDFGYDEVDRKTVEWLLAIGRSSAVRQVLQTADRELLPALLAATDPMAEWRAHHDQELHSWGTMRTAIAGRFALRSEASAPYLYRYVARVLPHDSEGAALVDAIRRDEATQIERGAIVGIGRRLVAERPSAEGNADASR